MSMRATRPGEEQAVDLVRIAHKELDVLRAAVRIAQVKLNCASEIAVKKRVAKSSYAPLTRRICACIITDTLSARSCISVNAAACPKP
jgi:hypothetical protein